MWGLWRQASDMPFTYNGIWMNQFNHTHHIFMHTTKREFRLIQKHYVNGLKQDCSNSIVNAQELLQYCIKPSI